MQFNLNPSKAPQFSSNISQSIFNILISPYTYSIVVSHSVSLKMVKVDDWLLWSKRRLMLISMMGFSGIQRILKSMNGSSRSGRKSKPTTSSSGSQRIMSTTALPENLRRLRLRTKSSGARRRSRSTTGSSGS